MNILENLSASELLPLKLRGLFEKNGYKKYKMSKFEPFDVYLTNKDYIDQRDIITFSDTDGRLLSLKPDVTMSVVRSSKDGEERKIYYIESVFRRDKIFGQFKEINQAGIERLYFGDKADACVETLSVAQGCLKEISEDYLLTIGSADIYREIIKGFTDDISAEKKLAEALRYKNPDYIREAASNLPQKTCEKLIALSAVYGDCKSSLNAISKILKDEPSTEAFAFLSAVVDKLEKRGLLDNVRLDLSLENDLNYYNGIMFRGYIEGVKTSVLSGGMYDNLMRKNGKSQNAIGFAVNLDELYETARNVSEYITVALPKGRLGEKAYKCFSCSGYVCPDLFEDNRKLVFECDGKPLRFILVKPSDVAVYVEQGAADIGIVGKDILLEQKPSVYELMDLNIGKCKLITAGKNGAIYDENRPLNVATKFPNVAKDYFGKRDRQINLIHLNGSIELAPIMNMSDIILDIVETGKTLKENNLVIIDTVADVSARLICNKTSYQFHYGKVVEIMKNFEENL